MHEVAIIPASREDLPVLAEINRAAYARETIAQFAFKHWPDEKNMFEFFKARIGERIDQTNTQVFKATDPSTGKTHGFVCWTLEDGTTPDKTPHRATADPTASAIRQMAEFMNLEFLMSMQADIQKLDSAREGERHFYLSAFAVEPASQGCGIGTQLLKHCLDLADQAGTRTWLTSFPGSHSLYLRHDFTDRSYCDTDLNKQWDKNRLRGYGIYRSYSMVRQPQKL